MSSGDAPAPVEAGTLWRAVRERTQTALARRILAPIPTTCEVVPDGGIDFVVRVMRERAARPRTLGPGAAPDTRDPFAPPWEPALLVGAVGRDHVALLNRFPVLEEHVLLVTRRFEPQEAPLTPGDLAAAAVALGDGERLAFYNAGAEAGASQAHKHLQVVGLPLGPTREPVPVEPVLRETVEETGGANHAGSGPGGAGPQIRHAERLPFRHALAWAEVGRDPARDHALYRRLLAAVRLDPGAPGPYNWLATRDWMLVVPRRCAEARGVEVNALGFAGALLARDAAQLETIRRVGPLAMLREVVPG